MKKIVYFVVASIMLTGCVLPTPTPTATFTPTSQFTYEVTTSGGYEVVFVGTQFEVTADNCGGTRDSTKSETRSRSFSAQINIDVTQKVATEFGLGGDLAGAKAALSLEIAHSLGLTMESATDTSSSVEIITPPNGRTITTLQWTETWSKGEVKIIRPDKSQLDTLPFLALNALSLEQLGSKTVDCNSGAVIAEATSVFAPTPKVIVVTPTPKPSMNYGQIIYEENFNNPLGWNIETGMKIENGSLIISPGYDAVPKNSAIFSNFILESQITLPSSGSMAFYLRHQYPPCAGWNCSIQIALYFNGRSYEVAARRFLGDNQEAIDIKKTTTSALYSGQPNKIVVQAKGNEYEVVLNDIFIFSFTDSSYSNGVITIDNAKDSSGDIEIEYIRLYEVP